MTLCIIVYSSGTTIDHQLTDLCKEPLGLKFSTFYPGGIFGSCSFFIPCGMRNPLILLGGMRITVNDGLKVVWEGEVDSTTPMADGGVEGLKVECTGKWGALLMRRHWNNVWVDTRVSQDVWAWTQSGTVNLFDSKRDSQLYVNPKASTYTNTTYGGFRYTMPTGHTVGRISFDYDFNKIDVAGSAWYISTYDVSGGSTLGTINSLGTGSYLGTPAADCKVMDIRFYSGSAQVVAGLGAGTPIYMRITNVKLYGDSGFGTMNPTNAIKDLQDVFTEINSDESHISSNTMKLEPLFMKWNDTLADFLEVTSSYGDASYNAWAAGLLASNDATIPDGKPVIYYEQQPGTTTTDYVVNLGEMVNPVSVGRVYDEIYNYIIVDHTDINGNHAYYTPSDISGLQQTESIAKYGQRDYVLTLNNMGTAEAVNYAVRFKNANCWSKFSISGNIQVRGYIRTSDFGKVPVAWVRAGKRIQIENYLQEITGAKAIFIINQTSYDYESDTLTISTGSPDPLAVISQQLNKKQ